MVKINYVDGDTETIESFENEFYGKQHFIYDKNIEMFIVFDHEKGDDCMMIPREFVKSIKNVEM